GLVDDVGRAAEHAGTWDRQRDARDREREHEHEQLALRCEQAEQASCRRAEVLRLLRWAHAHAHRAAHRRTGGARAAGWWWSGAVRAHAATSCSSVCDVTISAYVGHVATSWSCVPLPTSLPPSSTRIWCAWRMLAT